MTTTIDNSADLAALYVVCTKYFVRSHPAVVAIATHYVVSPSSSLRHACKGHVQPSRYIRPREKSTLPKRHTRDILPIHHPRHPLYITTCQHPTSLSRHPDRVLLILLPAQREETITAAQRLNSCSFKTLYLPARQMLFTCTAPSSSAVGTLVDPPPGPVSVSCAWSSPRPSTFYIRVLGSRFLHRERKKLHMWL